MAPSTSSEDKIRHTGQCGSKAMAAQTLFRTILWFHVFPDLFLVHLHDILLLSDHHPCELYMRHFFLFFFYMFYFSLLRVNYSSKQDIRIGPFPETICLYNSCLKKIAQSHAQCCTWSWEAKEQWIWQVSQPTRTRVSRLASVTPAHHLPEHRWVCSGWAPEISVTCLGLLLRVDSEAAFLFPFVMHNQVSGAKRKKLLCRWL